MRVSRPLRSTQGPQNAHAGQRSPARRVLSLYKAPCRESLPPHAFLRGGSEEKAFCGAAVALKNSSEQRTPPGLSFPAKTEKVARYLLPCTEVLWGAHDGQVIPSTEYRVSTPKPSKNHKQPAGHKPGGNKAVLINLHRGAMKAPLPHLPAPQAQEQRPHNGICSVLEVRDQLDRQQGEGPQVCAAEEARNGNTLLLEDRKQINRIPPVGGDLPIAVLLPTDGAGRSDEGVKINPAGKKRFLVFPNRLACVRVGKLNRSAALPTGGRSSVATPVGLLPCGSWLFLQGQFLTSLFSPPLYHRSENPVNITP